MQSLRITATKVNSQWMYLNCEVDKAGNMVVFLFWAMWDTAATTAFFKKAMRDAGDPEKVTIDKSGSKKAAMDGINSKKGKRDRGSPDQVSKHYCWTGSPSAEPDIETHVGFRSFWAASKVLAGIELMHMIRKGQIIVSEGESISFVDHLLFARGLIASGRRANRKFLSHWHYFTINATEPFSLRHSQGYLIDHWEQLQRYPDIRNRSFHDVV